MVPLLRGGVSITPSTAKSICEAAANGYVLPRAVEHMVVLAKAKAAKHDEEAMILLLAEDVNRLDMHAADLTTNKKDSQGTRLLITFKQHLAKIPGFRWIAQLGRVTKEALHR
jgi:ribosomal protein S15P/S13E